MENRSGGAVDFLDLAKRRRSVRGFQNRLIEKEKLMEILEAGRVAPSAKNFQPLHFIVAQDKAVREQIGTTYRGAWLPEAPVIIVVCGDHSQSWRRADGKDHCNIDAAIAIDHMTLAAANLGIGSCWVCAFNAMECHRLFRLPAHLEAIALLPLGYPAEGGVSQQTAKKRKQLEELVHWGSF